MEPTVEIQNFIRRTEPFNRLPADEVKRMIGRLTEVRFRKKQLIYIQHDTRIDGVDLVYEGMYRTFFYDADGQEVLSRDWPKYSTYGTHSLLFNGGLSIHTVEVDRNTVVLRMPPEYFRKLYETYDVIQEYIVSLFGSLMLNRLYAQYVLGRDKVSSGGNVESLFTRRLSTVSLRALVTCPQDLPIFKAAILMEESRTSCLLIERNGALIGYVTDIVLRNKVIAQKRNVEGPVSSVMEEPVVTIPRTSFVYETILMMFESSIRYLIVTNETSEPVGLLTRNDLLKDNGQSPFLYMQDLRMSGSHEQLAAKFRELPEVIHEMTESQVRAEILNRVITRASDDALRKTIDWTVKSLVEAPSEFAIVAIGNLGREELMLDVSQKLILVFGESDEFEVEELRQYYQLLMTRTAAQLKSLGIHPAGNRFLSSIPELVKSVDEWQRQYEQWIGDPKAMDVYPGFFDLRLVAGSEAVWLRLRSSIDSALKKPGPTFFSRLASYTLAYNLPLTFFRNIKTVSKGDRQLFDIYQAIGVLVDFTRYHALKNGVTAANTGDRLAELKDASIIQVKVYNELTQAFYYMMAMSLKYQARQVMLDGKAADTFINTAELTTIEVITLKQIFSLIEEFRQGFKNLPMRILGRSREL